MRSLDESEKKTRTRTRKIRVQSGCQAGEKGKKIQFSPLSSDSPLLDTHTIEEFLSFTFFRLRARTFT